MSSSIAIVAVSLAPPSAASGTLTAKPLEEYCHKRDFAKPRDPPPRLPPRGRRHRRIPLVSCRHEYWDHLTDQEPALASCASHHAIHAARPSTVTWCSCD